ncbi:hypothetical protein, partial [Roseibium sp. RKSG952]|uniref:hypothetical protein n=1 Tax=Roseibium sp. RKSG952 TaxID=2529384 RepID=UPI0018AD1F6E
IYETVDQCDMNIDLDGRLASQFSRFAYRGADGREVNVQECAPSKTAFEIKEDTSACEIDVDLDGRKATVMAQLSYRDSNGSNVVVR